MYHLRRLWNGIRRLKPGDEMWISEGPSDCWALLSAGHKAVAIPSATSLTKADISLLREGLPEGCVAAHVSRQRRAGDETLRGSETVVSTVEGACIAGWM